MMKYLLVEDERFAYEEMKRMMEKLRPDYQLEAWPLWSRPYNF